MGKRASLLLRVVSKSIDLIIALAAAEALPKAGWLAGFGYMLISDGLFQGRSIGKKLAGLKVLSADGNPCTIRDSILRNSILALGLLLWKTPYIGWLLLIVVYGLEFIILLGSKEEMRLGDEIAKTVVVESSEVAQEIK